MARKVGLSLCLAVIVGVAFAKPLGFFWAVDPQVVLDVRDDIRNYENLAQWPAALGRFENAGFVHCAPGEFVDAGWCLAPGSSGTLRYVVPTPPEAKAMLARLFFFNKQPEARTRLRVYRQGGSGAPVVFEHPYFTDARLDLSPVLAGSGGNVVLSFEGSNPTARPDAMIQYFELRLFSEPLPRPPSPAMMGLAVFALGLCGLPLIGWRHLLPLWVIVTLGFLLRYYALTQALYLHPDLDAWGYQQLARMLDLFSQTGFYSGGFNGREPLFPFLLKGWLGVFGDSETHVRLLSLVASMIAVLLTYRVGMKLFQRPVVGLLGAFLMAANLPLVRESVRGLRLEIEMILLLLLVEVACVNPALSGKGGVNPARSLWRRATFAGLLAGLLSLLRTNYLINLAPLLVFAFARRRPRTLVAAGLAMVLMVGLYAPHRWNTYRRYGHVLGDMNAQWWANLEFAGQPGWPTKLEMWRNPEGRGPRLTPFDYFFGLHTVPELLAGSARGCWKLIRHMEVLAFHRLLKRVTGLRLGWADLVFQAAGVVGLLWAVGIAGMRWLPVTFLLLIAHVAFLYDRGLVEPWRHTYPAFPFFLFGALLTCSRVMQWARRRPCAS